MHPGSNTGDDEVRWDDPAYLSDPRRAYDLLRDRCPVARRPADDVWVITGHAEAAACALDAEGFSNRVSSRLQIPNALDGEEHRRFRALIENCADARVHRFANAGVLGFEIDEVHGLNSSES